MRAASPRFGLGLAPLLLAATSCRAPRDLDGDRRTSAIPVSVEVVRPAPFQATLTLLGTVRPAETLALVATRGGTLTYPSRFAAGWRTGEEVSAGEPLATFENEAARLALAESRLGAESAAAELERSRRGFDAGIVPQAELASRQVADRLARERLKSAERDATRLSLTAPRRGRLVVTKAFPPGTDVPAGTVLGELAGNGTPHVEAVAAAAERVSLRAGLAVRFVRPGTEAAAGVGTLREVASVVDPNGTVRVVASVSDAQGLPAPGEGVELRVELAPRADALTVPEEALVPGSSGTGVFLVERANGTVARRVPVETGGRSNGRVEVTRGVADGDRIAVSGVTTLVDGAAVVEAVETPAAAKGR